MRPGETVDNVDTHTETVLRHVVCATGEPPLRIDSDNWLHALGTALDILDRQDRITRLACEVQPNGVVIAQDPVSGERYVIRPERGTLRIAAPGEEPPRRSVRARAPSPREAEPVDLTTGESPTLRTRRPTPSSPRTTAAGAMVLAVSGAALLAALAGLVGAWVG